MGQKNEQGTIERKWKDSRGLEKNRRSATFNIKKCTCADATASICAPEIKAKSSVDKVNDEDQSVIMLNGGD